MGWGAEVLAALVGSVVTLLLGWLGLRDQRARWQAEAQAAQEEAMDRRDAALRADIQMVIDRLDAENRRQNTELAECRSRAQRTDAEIQEKNQRIIDLILDRANAMHQHAIAQEAFLLERQKNIAMGEKFGRRLADAPGSGDADAV